jgi:hypothetical protein
LDVHDCEGDRDVDSDEFDAEKASDSAAAEAARSLLLRLGAGARDSLVYDEDWDEAGRLANWSAGLAAADAWPPLLGAHLLARAWRDIEPLQRQGFLAPILAGFICAGVGAPLPISWSSIWDSAACVRAGGASGRRSRTCSTGSPSSRPARAKFLRCTTV